MPEVSEPNKVTEAVLVKPSGTSAPGQTLFEIAVCSGIPQTLAVQALFAALGLDAHTILGSAKWIALFIFCESLTLMGLMIAFQALRRSTLWDLGVIPSSIKREVCLGIALVPALFFFNWMISSLFQMFLPMYSSPRNPLLDLIQTRGDLVFFVLLAVWAGGIKEELQRAFILNRFQVHLSIPITGLLIWSIAFGAGHALQGVDSAIGAGVYGLLFGAVYLWRGSILGPMVAHSLYDVVVLMGYWFTRTP